MFKRNLKSMATVKAPPDQKFPPVCKVGLTVNLCLFNNCKMSIINNPLLLKCLVKCLVFKIDEKRVKKCETVDNKNSRHFHL